VFGKSYDEVINLFWSIAWIESLAKILNDIYTTGEPLLPMKNLVEVKRTGKPALFQYGI
jgi:hypothetical protein